MRMAPILAGIAALAVTLPAGAPAHAQTSDDVPWSHPTTLTDCHGLEAEAMTGCLNRLMEYRSGTFGVLDTDRDRRLTRGELAAGIGEPEFDAWLRGADGRVSEAEFNRRHAPRAQFDAWDLNGDGWLNDDEIANGLIGLWDDDGNGWLNAAELERGLAG